MYIRKITDYSYDELTQIGIQEDYVNLCAIGMDNGYKYIISSAAHEDYLNDANSVLRKIEEDLLKTITELETNLINGNQVGEYVGTSNCGHFLSLKLSFVSYNKQISFLPVITNIGTSMHTMLGAGATSSDASALWVRDCYYQFLKSYFTSCLGMPESVLAEIENQYDPSSFDNVVNCISQISDWYENEFGALFVNSDETISAIECIKTILKKVYESYSKDDRLSVVISPMYYGNKDEFSGSGFIELRPELWDFKSDLNEIKYDCVGTFSQRSEQVLQNAYKKNTTNIFEDGPIVFDSTSPVSYEKFANQELYIACRTIYDFTCHRLSLSESSTPSNIEYLKLFYTVESGRVYIDKYEIITNEQVIDIPTYEKKNIVKAQVVVQENNFINTEKPVFDDVVVTKTPFEEYFMLHSIEELSKSLSTLLSAVIEEKGITILKNEKQFLNVLNDISKGDNLQRSILEIIVDANVQQYVVSLFESENNHVDIIIEELFNRIQNKLFNVEASKALTNAIRVVVENELNKSNTAVTYTLEPEHPEVSEESDDDDGFNPEDIDF